MSNKSYELNDVTIIIPIYTFATPMLEWLDECLGSAVKQGCSVLAYNDGSPIDITPITDKHRSVTLLAGKRNLGVSAARNRAIKGAKPGLILPLDCDDRLRDGAVAQMLEAWNTTRKPIYSDIEKFGDKVIPHYHVPKFETQLLDAYIGFCSVNVLHTKGMWRDVGKYNEKVVFYEDGDYNRRLMGKYGGYKVGEPLVQYRIHAAQRTAQFRFIGHVNKMRSIRVMPAMTTQEWEEKLKTIDPRNSSTKYTQIAPRDVCLAEYFGPSGRKYYRGLSTGKAYRVYNVEIVTAFQEDVDAKGSLLRPIKLPT